MNNDKQDEQKLFRDEVYSKLSCGETNLRKTGINNALKRILHDKVLMETIQKGEHSIIIAKYEWRHYAGADDPDPAFIHKTLSLDSKFSFPLRYYVSNRESLENWEFIYYHINAPIILDGTGEPKIDFTGIPLQKDSGYHSEHQVKEIENRYSGMKDPTPFLEFTTGSDILKNLEAEIKKILAKE